jgi:hypothetical protein
MAGSVPKGLLEVLQDGAQSAFSSAAAVWADLTTAGSRKQEWGVYSSRDSSSSSSRTYGRMLRDTTEEFMAHLRWSTPLLQVCGWVGCAATATAALSQLLTACPYHHHACLPCCLPAHQPNTRVPLPTHWDTRTILAFLDCLRSIQHSFVTTVSAAAADGDLETDSIDGSSSSTYLTMPPVTAALAAALLLVFTRPGGVALKDVALSPYCVLVKKEYWRCVLAVCCWLCAGFVLLGVLLCEGLLPMVAFDAIPIHSALQGADHNCCVLTRPSIIVGIAPSQARLLLSALLLL